MPPMDGQAANIFNSNFETPTPYDLGEGADSDTITQIEELPNGDAVYQIGDSLQEEIQDEEEYDFYENLADLVSGGAKTAIVSDLLEGIDNDISSRQEWEMSFNKGFKLLGFKLEESRDYPFMQACAAYDTSLSTAQLRFWSTARAELFPASGPANFQVVGEETDELEAQGEKNKAWMNHYLTHVDKEYYPDSERLLMYLGMVGCAFRKVYQDPITNRPVARFIDPQDFIVDNRSRTILSAPRLTQRMFLYKKEILLRQQSGYYSKDFSLPASDDNETESETTKTVNKIEGISESILENKHLYQIYEVHADLDLDGFEHEDEDGEYTGIPLPYIVTICSANREVLSIRRNWVAEDPTFARIQCFVHYNYLPGFGIYGIGLSQLLGSNSNALTSILRQLIDAGTLKNFPGGLRVKGMRLEKNDKPIGPSEFLEIETGGLPIQDAIMMMPFNEPSVVLNALRNELIQQTQQLAGTAETQISEAKADAPVGTTLALLEVQNKMQSSVLRSLHMSLSNELELLYRLFGEGMDEDNPYDFKAPGIAAQITKHDFTDNIKIIPVSDPNLTTSTQRLLRAEAILRLAQSAPELHDLRNAYHRMYSAMGVTDLDKLLPPEQDILPLDPITENMNAMEGKPVKAAVWQDHQSHIAVHQVFAQQNPDIQAMNAHIQEHRAFDYYIQMQHAMQMEMPPLDQLENPEVQNAIAVQAAEVAMQQRQALEAQNPPPLDPTKVMMADMESRVEIAKLKQEEARLRVENEAFKAQLAYESAVKKIAADREMAEEKNETDLTIAEMKQETDVHNMQQKLKQQERKTSHER